MNQVILFFKRTFFAVLLGGMTFDPDLNSNTIFIHIALWTTFFALPLSLGHSNLSQLFKSLISAFFLSFIILIVKVINYKIRNEFNKPEQDNDTLVLSNENDSKSIEAKDNEEISEKQSDSRSYETETDFNDSKKSSPSQESEPETPSESKIKKTKIVTRIVKHHFVDEDGNAMSYEIPEEVETTASSSNDEVNIPEVELPSETKDSEISPKELYHELDKTEEKEEDIPEEHKVKIKLLPWWKINIQTDLLTLDETFDEDFISVIIPTILSFSTSFTLVYFVVPLAVTHSIFLYIALSSALFSLVKSPQPENFSQTPENTQTRFARSWYVLLFSIIIAIIDKGPWEIPGWIETFFIRALFCTPLVFFFGLFPQPKTLGNYLLEQVNIYILGGTSILHGLKSLPGMLALSLILSGIAYSVQENADKYYIVGVYVAILFAVTLFFSRVPLENSAYVAGIFTKLDAKVFLEHQDNYPVEMRLPFHPRNDFLRELGTSIIGGVIFYGVFWASKLAHIATSGLITIVAAAVAIIGFLNYEIYPQLRRPFPFFGVKGQPFIKPLPEDVDEDWNTQKNPLKIETVFLWTRIVERLLLHPGLFSLIAWLTVKTGDKWAGAMVVIGGIFYLRKSMSDCSLHYRALAILTLALIESNNTENSVWTFLGHIPPAAAIYGSLFLALKLRELYKKLGFMLIYYAPWTFSVSSLVHAILFLIGIPLLVFQIAVSFVTTLFSVPIYPLSGGTLFLPSYPHTLKYWERDYKTVRQDASTTKLAAALGMEGVGTGESSRNNLDSVFYENLNVALGDILYDSARMGRLGRVCEGDFFLLTSGDLSALLHIVSLGFGHLDYQVRGLEFRGTPCQEHELRAVSEAAEWDSTSLIKALKTHWSTWTITNKSLRIKTYASSEVDAGQILQAYDSRLELLKAIILSILYTWIKHPRFRESITMLFPPDQDFDVDLISFSENVDLDYDKSIEGITLENFRKTYGGWVRYLYDMQGGITNENRKSSVNSLSKSEEKEEELEDSEKENVDEDFERVIRIAFHLTATARRAVIFAGPNDSGLDYDAKYYAFFKGDIKLYNERDDWILPLYEMMMEIISTGGREALFVMQISFSDPEYAEDYDSLNEILEEVSRDYVICAESDPKWVGGIVKQTEHMVTLRPVGEGHRGLDIDFLGMLENGRGWMDGRNGMRARTGFKLMNLNLGFRDFIVSKINPESVRSLWSSQIQELVFMRNTEDERGSIQMCPPVLRNIISQSGDLPVGYPISISPVLKAYESLRMYNNPWKKDD